MGLQTYSSGADGSFPSSLSALGTGTTIGFVRRMKVDTILNVTGYNGVGLCSVDGGSSGTVRASLMAIDNGGPKKITFNWGGGQQSIGPIAAASWGAAGTYVVLYFIYDYAAFTYTMGVFDGTGTNTLLDGLAKGTSAFWKTGTFNGAIANSLAANGIFHDNFAYTGGGTNAPASVVDGVGLLSAFRASGFEDAIPGYVTADNSNFYDYWYYDTAGSTVAGQLSVESLDLSGTYSYTAGGVWPAAVSTPTTVVASPSSVQVNLPAGGTNTATLETLDQNSNVMASRSWAINSGPNAAVATAAIVGNVLTVTSVAGGQTSLTVKDTAAGGSSATDATVQITVGTEYDWSSSNTSVVTTGTGAATETLTDPSGNTAGGTATVLITRHGTSATCEISVITPSSSQGGSGSPNEPTGMTVGMNTGSLTQTPSQVQNATWVVGTTIQNTFQQFSPSVVSPAPTVPWNTTLYSTGYAGCLTLCPDGPGYRITYPANYGGSFSPVRFGTPLNIPSSGLTGLGYFSWWMRLSGSPAWSWNFTGGGTQITMKLWEPRTVAPAGGSDTNHVVRLAIDSGSGQAQGYLNFVLQGPGSQNTDNPNITGAAYNASTNYRVGDTVVSGGTFYLSILTPNTGNTPPNATYWKAITPSYSFYGVEPNGLLPTDDNWHHCEILAQQDSPAGSSNGTLQMWVDGTPVCLDGATLPMTGLNFIAAGDAFGWPYWMFDPVWGGGSSTPLNTLFYDIDRLYMSQK